MRSQNRRHDVPLLSKYANADTTKRILEGRSLRWSSPLLFNDPFDVPRDLELPFDSSTLRSAIAKRFEAYIDGAAAPKSHAAVAILAAMLKADPSRRPEMLSALQDTMHLATVPVEIAIAGLRSAWQDKVRHLRILCLSEVADSATMWAHYADNHRGAVLQFESDDERDSAFLLAEPVMYQDRKPELPPLDEWVRAFMGEEEIDWDRYFREYYHVKSREWSYEREYRAISATVDDTALYYDSPFFAEDLRGVVLGSAMDSANESEIRGLASSYPDVILYRARVDHVARRVVAEPSP